MAKYDYDLIVIGGGAGGLTASTFAGQSAAKTLLIEKEEKLGGDCLHYGCVPSKTLIKSSYVYKVIKDSQRYGLPQAAIAPVDFKQLAKRVKSVIDTIQPHDEPEYLKDKYNVETQFGAPKFVDQHTIELNGKKISSRFFVIATGSSPYIPPVEGIEDVNYLTNITIFSLDKLPPSLIVMGAGPIGMEMAQCFARLGSKVTVVQNKRLILDKEDEDVSQYMMDLLKTEGIEFILNSNASKVEQSAGRVKMTLNNVQTSFNSVIEADALLVSAGRVPNVDGLDLDKASVEYSNKGVRVDAHCRTNVKNIYAVGDVSGGYQFTHVASYEAVVAICNAILKLPRKTDYTKTPWVTYLDPEVASIGYNEKMANDAGIKYKIHKASLEHNDRALAEGENKGFIKIVFNEKGKVIGVQIVGFHAGDLIAEWIPLLNGNVKLSAISDAIHPYPTMAEVNKNAAVEYVVSTIPGWTKKVSKFLFGYQGKV